ncbi:AI-2E family transporter [Nocardioides sp. BP30]|uniref:AI-2E family transporter n=1 Tax=Nocardioides sp. BP30 TaxID=3036374 RepID=UPI002468D7C0|nr:AI-2E family transporter [Nocardioides sp. BP30]WGL53373.1 AI-2E family transporter [Nocardioides sp. BP30]
MSEGPTEQPPVPGQDRQRTERFRRGETESERQRNERLAARLYAQWAQLREERQAQLTPPPIPVAATSGGRKVEVPYGIELAASWGWRLLVIAAAGWCLFKVLGFLEVVVVPVVIAMLISALVVPVVALLQRIGLPRGLAALLVLILVIGVVGSLLFFAGHQVATGASDLADQTVKGLEEIRHWLKTGPLHASDNQINTWIDRLQHEVTKAGSGGNPLGKVTEVGGVAADVLASLFIVLFSTYFFLAEGDKIWAWVVKLTPRAARERVDSSGRVAWISLTQFVRATVIVAAVDAIGIMIVAAILRVPFVAAIGVLVFLGAFVPLIGATIAGTVAVLVALVDHGVVTALIMLGGVILVQQLEAHGLQPFLMGRWVSVHPLAVIISIATGVLVAGVAGALVAVPLAAALNAVGQHLAADSSPPDPEEDEGALLTEGEQEELEEAEESAHE